MPNSIQPGDLPRGISTGGGTGGVLHIRPERRRQAQRAVPELQRRPAVRELELARQPVERERARRSPQLSSFLSRFHSGRVLFL